MMRCLFPAYPALLGLICLALAACASLDPYAQPPVAQRLQRDDAIGDCARLFRASDTAIDAAGTVSYTHLDVYKRQGAGGDRPRDGDR